MTWFSSTDLAWTPASSRLVTARLISVAITFAVPLLGSAALAVFLSPSFWWVTGGLAALAVWAGWLGWRSATAHGWAERADDLLVRRGRIVRSVTVVPYGRMQYVEVSAGPLARALGIASVQLHTASSGTDASLHGVPAEEAARLRDRLSALGEARMAGL